MVSATRDGEYVAERIELGGEALRQSDTARRTAVEELARVTAASDRQKRFYESLISSTPDLVYAFDLDYHLTFANKALLEMWGRTLEQSVGKSLIELGYEPWHAEMHEREIDRVIATKAAIRGVVGFDHAVLGKRTYDYIFTPVFDASGNVEAVAGTTRDITDIKRAEEHQALLLDELNHRVKNTFATIQAIAAHTLRSARDLPSAREALERRIVSMAKAHDLLTKHSWTGAKLGDVVTRALEAFSPAQTTISGEPVGITSRQTLALSLALHELATNATKYGALSCAEGRVGVEWTVEDGTLRLAWEESGGPPVAVPAVSGFGSRLLQQLVHDLRGTIALDYRPAGLRCGIAAPL